MKRRKLDIKLYSPHALLHLIQKLTRVKDDTKNNACKNGTGLRRHFSFQYELGSQCTSRKMNE